MSTSQETSSLRVKNPTPELDEVLDLLNEIAEDLGCSSSPYRGNGTLDGKALQEVIDEIYCYIHEGELEPEKEPPGITQVSYDTVKAYGQMSSSGIPASWVGGSFQLPTGRMSASPPVTQSLPRVVPLRSTYPHMPVDLPDTLETQPSMWKRMKAWLDGRPFDEPTYVNGKPSSGASS